MRTIYIDIKMTIKNDKTHSKIAKILIKIKMKNE